MSSARSSGCGSWLPLIVVTPLVLVHQSQPRQLVLRTAAHARHVRRTAHLRSSSIKQIQKLTESVPGIDIVLTGTAHGLAGLAFHSAEMTAGRPWVTSYDNLNHTVFEEYRLHALNTRDVFDAVVHTSQDYREYAGQLDRFFNLTGGVGRYMDALMDLPDKVLADFDESRFFGKYLAEFAKHGLLSHVMSYLYEMTSKTIEFYMLQRLYKASGGADGDFHSALEDLIDRGFVQNFNQTSYGLLLPGALNFVMTSMSDIDPKMLSAWRAVTASYGGAGSPGAYCEPLVRQLLCESDDSLPAFSPHYVHIQSTQPPVLRAHKNAKSDEVPWPPAHDLKLLAGMFGVINEEGIEGLGIMPDGGGCWDLTIAQSKLGAVDAHWLTAGEAFDGSDKSRQVRPMIGAAARGLKKLLRYWPDAPRVSSVRFILVTSKNLNPDVEALFKCIAADVREYVQKVTGCTWKFEHISGNRFRCDLVPTKWSALFGYPPP